MAQPTLPANDCKFLSVASLGSGGFLAVTVFGSGGFLAVAFIGCESLHACVQFVDDVADATPTQACMHHVGSCKHVQDLCV